jgi:hypothetical protein
LSTFTAGSICLASSALMRREVTPTAYLLLGREVGLQVSPVLARREHQRSDRPERAVTSDAVSPGLEVSQALEREPGFGTLL